MAGSQGEVRGLDKVTPTKKTVWGVSAGTFIAAASLILTHQQEVSRILWMLQHTPNMQYVVNAIPQLENSSAQGRIRLTEIENKHKRDTDSLVHLIQTLQRAVDVLRDGKKPFDSVRVTTSTGERKFFKNETPWVWRKRD